MRNEDLYHFAEHSEDSLLHQRLTEQAQAYEECQSHETTNG